MKERITKMLIDSKKKQINEDKTKKAYVDMLKTYETYKNNIEKENKK